MRNMATTRVDHLRGMFAFAPSGTSAGGVLLVARDWESSDSTTPEIWRPASLGLELKSILQLPEVGRSFNWSAVSHLFVVPFHSPTEAIVERVRKLEPGHLLTSLRAAAGDRALLGS